MEAGADTRVLDLTAAEVVVAVATVVAAATDMVEAAAAILVAAPARAVVKDIVMGLPFVGEVSGLSLRDGELVARASLLIIIIGDSAAWLGGGCRSPASVAASSVA